MGSYFRHFSSAFLPSQIGKNMTYFLRVKKLITALEANVNG
jgi:hypothetical protein